MYGLLPFSIALICYYFSGKCTGTSNDENQVIATMMIVKTRKMSTARKFMKSEEMTQQIVK